MDNLLINTKEAAQKLGISYGTLLGMVKGNKIPFVRLGRLIRFSPDSLTEWAKAREVAVAVAVTK